MDALSITAPGPDDEGPFLHAVRESSALHRPWVDPPATPSAYREYLAGAGERRRSYLLRSGERLVGVANASEIVRGAFLSCYLGYYAFAGGAGRGLMTAGMAMVLDDLFGAQGLHRAEANIQPANTRSIALVRRLGFRREGFSPGYLHIDGAWRDHERWAILSTDPRPPAT